MFKSSMEEATPTTSLNEEAEEEILALKSIFDEETFEFEENHGLIRTTPDCDEEGEARHTLVPPSAGLPATVRNLPPVEVEFSIPPGYPIREPPSISSLSCPWMQDETLENLKKEILDLWRQEPVLYTWHDHLKERAGELSTVKPGALQVYSEEALQVCLKYDEERSSKNFDKSWHLCEICFETGTGNNFEKLSKCGHFFCRQCLMEYVTVKTAPPARCAVGCPGSGCEEEVPDCLLDDLVEAADRAALEAYRQRRAEFKLLAAGQRLLWCPRIKCQERSDLLEETLAICSSCSYAFCPRCALAFHGVDLCGDLRRKKEAAEAAEAARKLAEARNKFMGELRRKRIRLGRRNCPRCRSTALGMEGQMNRCMALACRYEFCVFCGGDFHGNDEECKLPWNSGYRSPAPVGGSRLLVFGAASGPRSKSANSELSSSVFGVWRGKKEQENVAVKYLTSKEFKNKMDTKYGREMMSLLVALNRDSIETKTSRSRPETRLTYKDQKKTSKSDRVSLAKGLENITAQEKAFKCCPRCKVPIEKNEGCPHMSCAWCTHYFCWRCLGELKAGRCNCD